MSNLFHLTLKLYNATIKQIYSTVLFYALLIDLSQHIVWEMEKLMKNERRRMMKNNE